MSRLIHKLEIDYRKGKYEFYELPDDPIFLSCDFQGEKLVVWYEFERDQSMLKQYKFLVVRTGEVFNRSPAFTYLGTAYDRNIESPFVLHVYYSKN